MRCKLLTNVYCIEHSDSFLNEVVPEYEMKRSGIDPDTPGSFYGFLYIEAGEEGVYDDMEEVFESDLGSCTRIEKEYLDFNI